MGLSSGVSLRQIDFDMQQLDKLTASGPCQSTVALVLGTKPGARQVYQQPRLTREFCMSELPVGVLHFSLLVIKL